MYVKFFVNQVGSKVFLSQMHMYNGKQSFRSKCLLKIATLNTEINDFTSFTTKHAPQKIRVVVYSTPEMFRSETLGKYTQK